MDSDSTFEVFKSNMYFVKRYFRNNKIARLREVKSIRVLTALFRISKANGKVANLIATN